MSGRLSWNECVRMLRRIEAKHDAIVDVLLDRLAQAQRLVAQTRKRDLLRKWRREHDAKRTSDRLHLRLHWSVDQCGTIAAAAGKLPGPGVRMLHVMFDRDAFANSYGRRMSEHVAIAGPMGALPC